MLPRLPRADRKTLLLGTALASTLLLGTVTASAPAKAAATCTVGGVVEAIPAPTTPIVLDRDLPIVCRNGDTRIGVGVNAIDLYTDANLATIYLNNSGDLTTTYVAPGGRRGIRAYSHTAVSSVTVINSGDIDAYLTGIYARTRGGEVYVFNSGRITSVFDGIQAFGGIIANTPDSPVSVINTGDIDSQQQGTAISAITYGENSNVYVFNSGPLSGGRTGILGGARAAGSPIDIWNSGDIAATSTTGFVYGIFAETYGDADSSIGIWNSGRITAYAGPAGFNAIGIRARGIGAGPIPVTIWNSGDIWATSAGQDAFGIFADTGPPGSSIDIWNSGTIRATADDGDAVGIDTLPAGAGSRIDVTNSGGIWATASDDAYGIRARPFEATTIGIVNTGMIAVTAGDVAYGVDAEVDSGSPITIVNSGKIQATTTTDSAVGIRAFAEGAGSPVTIWNAGSVFAEGPSNAPAGNIAGIYTSSSSGTTITNSGDIGASSNLAIKVTDGPVEIFNTGTITGFVLLDADDTFINQAGGVFEARGRSDFDYYMGAAGTNDLFINQSGGTVHAAGSATTAETTRFVNLETFRNQGLISTVDKGTGDRFILSNALNGTNHNFIASGNSTVALDVFLDGPASPKDTFTIQGNVFGQTKVRIKNTNSGGGTFNPTGIPVIFVDGNTNPNAFVMEQPADAGFFDYDIFFVPTGSGFWELRSFPGGGAHLLPQLTTAAQDIWHQGSSTWFDRTADLRVLLNGGAAPAAYASNGASSSSYNFTPAVWARGSGSWLDREDSQTTRAYGRVYTYDLDRDLDTLDFQMGLDLGHRDLFSPDDILVFGLLGGFVHADLDYDSLIRSFDFDGGQVGAYATYLKGGLFVDTLLNAHIYELDPNGARGFPSSLDATTIGLRTDSGYRFGSFTGGPFWEPLATIEVTWADIDNFARDGNIVTFDDDANVRGRLGIRAGTTMQVWQDTLMEPFVIGSLWGNFTDDNRATVVSTGRTFRFQDDLDDVWGEVSAGVNFFNPSAATAVFAKLDVTFGDDLTGVGGKAGMRYNW